MKRAGAGDSKRCDQVERDVLERQAAGLRGAWRVLPAITQPKRSPGAFAAFGRHTHPARPGTDQAPDPLEVEGVTPAGPPGPTRSTPSWTAVTLKLLSNFTVTCVPSALVMCAS